MSISSANSYNPSSNNTLQYAKNESSGKDTVSGAGGSAAGNSRAEYLQTLSEQYPKANLNLSNSHTFGESGSTTLNISPAYVDKAMNDPQAAKNLDRLAGLAESFEFGTQSMMPGGSQVTKVSFTVDEKGGVSCSCEYSNSSDSKTSISTSDDDKLRYEEKLRERLLAQLEGRQLQRNDNGQTEATNQNMANYPYSNLIDLYA